MALLERFTQALLGQSVLQDIAEGWDDEDYFRDQKRMMKWIRKTHKQSTEEEEEHYKDYFDGSHHTDGYSDFLVI